MRSAIDTAPPDSLHQRKHAHHRWFVGLTLLAVVFLICDNVSRFAYLQAVNSIETSDVQRGKAAIPSEARERWTILPANAVDTRWWILYSEQALRDGVWRVRETSLDNYPHGREVHWSSGLVWIMTSIARVSSWLTGKSAMDAVQTAAYWAGPLIFVAFAGVLGSLTGRRFGWGYGGFLVLISATCFPIYEMFRMGEADHHGLVFLAIGGSMLSILAGGVGFVQSTEEGAVDRAQVLLPCERQAKKWFVAAGLFGAAGMWVSAATFIPVLGAFAIGAALAAGVSRRIGAEAALKPDLWRLWARWGCLGSVLFYLLEYFPAHLGWRLEVNHPLYALAWLCGGELLFRICRKLSGGVFIRAGVAERVVTLGAVLGVVIPLVVARLWSEATFLVADKFLLSLLTEHVRELETLFAAVSGLQLLEYFAWPSFVILGATLLLRAKVSNSGTALLVFGIGVAAVLQVQGIVQVRWAGVATVAWSICAVFVSILYFGRHHAKPIPYSTVLPLLCILLFAVGAYPQLSLRTLLDIRSVSENLPQSIIPPILLRDVAHRLLQASPAQRPVVLSDPTSSTELTYFANIPTLGTLYWENAAGLKRASRILAAASEVEARDLLKEAKVTHIVMPSWDRLSSASPHIRLLQKTGELPRSQTTPFFDRILQGTECPNWLRPFHYPIPPEFGLQGETIRILEVRHDQSRFESFFHQGVYHTEKGEFPIAAEMFRKALGEKPGNPTATRWLDEVSSKLREQDAPAALHALDRETISPPKTQNTP